MSKLAELNAKSAALKKEMAEHEAPYFEEALALIEDLKVLPSLARLQEIVAELPDSPARSAISNVAAAMAAAGQMLSMGLPNLRQIIDPTIVTPTSVVVGPAAEPVVPPADVVPNQVPAEG